jgi:hypothetical protein
MSLLNLYNQLYIYQTNYKSDVSKSATCFYISWLPLSVSRHIRQNGQLHSKWVKILPNTCTRIKFSIKTPECPQREYYNSKRDVWAPCRLWMGVYNFCTTHSTQNTKISLLVYFSWQHKYKYFLQHGQTDKQTDWQTNFTCIYLVRPTASLSYWQTKQLHHTIIK